MNNKIYRSELNKLANEKGIKYYLKYNRFELAEKLGIELLKPTPKPKTTRVYSRHVKIISPDGTITTYSSMTQAAKALGKFPAQIYAMIAKGDAGFLT